MVEKYHVRGIGEQVVTSFIKLQVLGSLGVQDVHCAPGITDGSPPPMAGHDHLLPWGSSIHLCHLVIAGDPVRRNQDTVGGDDVKPCVGEHGGQCR